MIKQQVAQASAHDAYSLYRKELEAAWEAQKQLKDRMTMEQWAIQKSPKYASSDHATATAMPFTTNTNSGASGGFITTGTSTTRTTYDTYAYDSLGAIREVITQEVAQAVAEATNELSEQLKDIQEQIDEIWEVLNDDDE